MSLRLEGAVVRFGDRSALDGVSLEPAAGAMTAILGPNGAGKSTLLRALAGLLPLSAGRLTLDGSEVSTLPRRELARAVTWLPQHADVPFPFPVEQVVMMGRYAHLRRWEAEGERERSAVESALTQVDAADLRGRPFTELSGGEQKRVLLARTLATEAPVLLLDEPIADLDVRHALEFLAMLRRLGRTVLLAIHDLNLAMRTCDRFVLLDRGRVVAHGSAPEVLTPERVSEVFGVEARRTADGTGLIVEPRAPGRSS